MSTKPLKISLITICFNNEADIRQTIESVINQSYENYEYIVVDGASKDNTLSIVNEYVDSIDRIISEPDEGIYDAINKGIQLTTGDVVGLIHAGDRLFDGHVLQKVADHFLKNDIDAMYGHSILVDNQDKPFRVNKSPKYRKSLFKMGWMPSHQSIYIKRNVFDTLGYYRLDLGGSADYEFVLRYFYINNLKIKRLDEFILRFAIGGRSTTNYRKRLWLSQKRHLKAWHINGIRPPFYLIPVKLVRKIKQFYLAAFYRLIGAN
jgi:glycosyltransferase